MNERRLEGRIALITGASRGMRVAPLRGAMRAEGAAVAVTARSEAELSDRWWKRLSKAVAEPWPITGGSCGTRGHGPRRRESSNSPRVLWNDRYPGEQRRYRAAVSSPRPVSRILTTPFWNQDSWL